MILSDYDIAQYRRNQGISIEPYRKENLNPASYDLTLGNAIITDVRGLDSNWVDLTEEKDYFLEPGEFVLGTTVERVALPLDLAAQVNGKSSLGRMGLAIHVTAGYVDPGFEGEITLEIVNFSRYHFVLEPGMKIAQLIFYRMASAPTRDYSETGRYHHQTGPTLSRYYEG